MAKRASKYEKKITVREDVTFDDLLGVAVKKPVRKKRAEKPDYPKTG